MDKMEQIAYKFKISSMNADIYEEEDEAYALNDEFRFYTHCNVVDDYEIRTVKQLVEIPEAVTLGYKIIMMYNMFMNRGIEQHMMPCRWPYPAVHIATDVVKLYEKK
jgi:hypothetical protein